MTEPKELVRMLRTGAWRCRTGILLLPADALGKEATIAAKLDVQHMDFVAYLIEHAPAGSKYVNLTLEDLFRFLDDIANSASGMDCVLISDIDVAAVKLTSVERTELWHRLLSDFPHRRKAVLFGVPDHMDGIRVLQEASIRNEWEHAGRVAKWQN